MAKQSAKDDIPADMWLRVATDALARYVAGGGNLSIFIGDDLNIAVHLPGIQIDDLRLAPAFQAMIDRAQLVYVPPTPEPTP